MFTLKELLTALRHTHKALGVINPMSDLLELRNTCQEHDIALKVGLGGTLEIITVPGKAGIIDFLIVNETVIPRPVIHQEEVIELHDALEITSSLISEHCLSAVVAGGKVIRVRDLTGKTHVAIDDLEEAAVITKKLECFEKLVSSGSLFSSVKSFMRARLPSLEIPKGIAPTTERPPWLFKRPGQPHATVTWDIRRAYRSALQSIEQLAHFSCLDEVHESPSPQKRDARDGDGDGHALGSREGDQKNQPGCYFITNIRQIVEDTWCPLQEGWYYHSTLNYFNKFIQYDILFEQIASIRYPSAIFTEAFKTIDQELTPAASGPI